jgi:spore coat protein U-like protein
MRRALIALALLLTLPLPAAAAPAPVPAAPDRCDFDNGALQLAFGPYNVLSLFPLDVNGQVSFTCRGNDFTATILLSHGLSGNADSRAMHQLNSPNSLLYNVYIDPGHTQIWSDGSFNGNPVIVIARRNQRVDLPFYGRIPALQDVNTGLYVDVLFVTIQF